MDCGPASPGAVGHLFPKSWGLGPATEFTSRLSLMERASLVGHWAWFLCALFPSGAYEFTEAGRGS